MKKFKILTSLVFIAIIAAILLTSCGEDSAPTNTNTGSGWHPNLNFSVGQQFVYTNDSLHSNGTTHNFTRRRTNSTIAAQVTYQGQVCYMVTGTTFDSTNNQSTPELPYYIRYEQNSGIYFQYGIRQLINPGLPGSWDTVGNFNVSRGSTYFISNINYSVPLPQPYGNVNFTGPLNGRIADSTSIQQWSNNASIPCYRIELTASISGNSQLGTITANIIIDYYLGYGSPTGIVEVKLRPFNFVVAGQVNVPQPGYDRKLYSHNP